MNELEILTNELNGIIAGIRLSSTEMALDLPVRPPDIKKESLLVLEQRGLCRLSEETRQLELERLAKLDRKRRALRERKPYTRKRGTVHPKKKAATRRRRLVRNWAHNPFGCVLHGYGSHAIDRELWDKYIQPLFIKYRAEDLKIHKRKRDLKGQYYGTKVNPYTIYSLEVLHCTDGSVFDGAGLELYHLSGGSV